MKASDISEKYTLKIANAQTKICLTEGLQSFEPIEQLEFDLETEIIKYGRLCCDSVLSVLADSSLIAKRIKALRESRNLTQEYVAEQLKMSQTGYGNLERGKYEISMRRIKQVCELYEIEVYRILGQKFEIEI